MNMLNKNKKSVLQVKTKDGVVLTEVNLLGLSYMEEMECYLFKILEDKNFGIMCSTAYMKKEEENKDIYIVKEDYLCGMDILDKVSNFVKKELATKVFKDVFGGSSESFKEAFKKICKEESDKESIEETSNSDSVITESHLAIVDGAYKCLVELTNSPIRQMIYVNLNEMGVCCMNRLVNLECKCHSEAVDLSNAVKFIRDFIKQVEKALDKKARDTKIDDFVNSLRNKIIIFKNNYDLAPNHIVSSLPFLEKTLDLQDNDLEKLRAKLKETHNLTLEIDSNVDKLELIFKISERI